MPADEVAWFELILATERMHRMAEELRANASPDRLKAVLRELLEALGANDTTAEAARAEGMVPLLTGLLKRSDDDEVLSLAADALGACSGLMAASGRTRTFAYGGHSLALKEGPLGDGIGARVWTVAHTLNRELARHPGLVCGQRVLEIGAGCGACGILAAKLGAQQVVLTDYVGAVLANLRDCVHLNAGGGGGGQAGAEQQPGAAAVQAGGTEGRGGGGGEQHAAARQQRGAAWDAPPMHVRFYDWQRSLELLAPAERAELRRVPGVAEGVAASAVPGATIDTASNDCGAPELGDGWGEGERGQGQRAGGARGGQFDVVLGSDVLYEWQMVETVPAVLRHRLRPGGAALLCCAVREAAMFGAFRAALRALGLRLGMTPVQPDAADLLDVRQDYEGGYVLLAIEHAAAPAEWHRPDLFPLHGE